MLRIDRTPPLSQVDREWAATRLEKGARRAFQSNLIFAAEVAALVLTCSNASPTITLVLTYYRRREKLALIRAAPSFPNASSLNQHAERPHEHSIDFETLGRTPPPYVAKDPAHNLWRSSWNHCLSSSFSAYRPRATATLELMITCMRTRTRVSSPQSQRRHSFRSQTGTLHKYT